MTLELYNFSQSTCSIKVRLLLEEKKLLWKDNRLVSANNDHLSEWYLKLNPNGVVPTLIHNGKSIYESTAILEYLEDTFPESCLRPTDPYLCSQVRAWLIFVDVWPAPAIRTPSFHFGGLLEKFKKMPDEKFNELKRRRPLKRNSITLSTKTMVLLKANYLNHFRSCDVVSQEWTSFLMNLEVLGCLVKVTR